MGTDAPFNTTIQGEIEVGAVSTKRIVNSDQFFSKHFTPSGKEFFIFSQIGDFVKGFLLPGARDNSHINRSKSYQIKVYEAKKNGIDYYFEEGQIEEFFTNRQLQRYIKRYELENKMVRIVYIGRKKSGYGGHSAKVYRVFLDKGVFEAKESQLNEPRKRKSNRGPAGSKSRRTINRRKTGRTVRAGTAS